MRKLFLCLLLIFVFGSSYGQQIKASKKIEGLISYTYLNYDSPVQIQYKAFIYEGSGSYSYKWRLKEEEFIKSSEKATYTNKFTCEKGKRPEQTIYCEVTDLITKKKTLLKTTHSVESCN